MCNKQAGAGPSPGCGACWHPVGCRRSSEGHHLSCHWGHLHHLDSWLLWGQFHWAAPAVWVFKERSHWEIHLWSFTMFQRGRKPWCHPVSLQPHLLQNIWKASEGPRCLHCSSATTNGRRLSVQAGSFEHGFNWKSKSKCLQWLSEWKVSRNITWSLDPQWHWLFAVE